MDATLEGVKRDRVELLARRVLWLDRYRRVLAVLAAIIASPLLIAWLADDFTARWPAFHDAREVAGDTVLAIVGCAIAVVTWWIAEVTFAWLAASWETEHAQLVRDRGLPKAELIVRKR